MNLPGLNILYSIATNPVQAIAIETIAKGTMRPAFTMMNKGVDIESRKYSATLEFLYQFICLGLHLLVAERGKKAGFAIAKKLFANQKNTGFEMFKTFEEAVKCTNAPPLVKGSIMLGSILASVIALTVVAPKLNHMIIPPILKKLGLKSNAHSQDKEPILEAAKLNNSNNSNEILLPHNICASHLNVVA